jgi:hypothetical protein
MKFAHPSFPLAFDVLRRFADVLSLLWIFSQSSSTPTEGVFTLVRSPHLAFVCFVQTRADLATLPLPFFLVAFPLLR